MITAPAIKITGCRGQRELHVSTAFAIVVDRMDKREIRLPVGRIQRQHQRVIEYAEIDGVCGGTLFAKIAMIDRSRTLPKRGGRPPCCRYERKNWVEPLPCHVRRGAAFCTARCRRACTNPMPRPERNHWPNRPYSVGSTYPGGRIRSCRGDHYGSAHGKLFVFPRRDVIGRRRLLRHAGEHHRCEKRSRMRGGHSEDALHEERQVNDHAEHGRSRP